MRTTARQVLAQGAVAGLLGYGCVAVIFAVANVLAGQSPFQTAAILGATLFYGVTDPATVVVIPAYVFAFNGVHLVAFLGFGVLGAWLTAVASRGEQLWYFALFFWLFVATHLIGAAQVFALPLADTLSSAAVWGAGIAAAVVMATYLVRANPALRGREAW